MPFLLKTIPEALTSGRFSDAVFERKAAGTELPEKKYTALEKKMNRRHYAAVEKARKLLRKGRSGEAAAVLLSEAFRQNWKEACLYLDFK